MKIQPLLTQPEFLRREVDSIFKDNSLRLVNAVFGNGFGVSPEKVMFFSLSEDDRWSCFLFALDKTFGARMYRHEITGNVEGWILDSLFRGISTKIRWNGRNGARPPGDALWRILGTAPPSQNMVACRVDEVGVAAMDFKGRARSRHMKLISSTVFVFHFFLDFSVTQVMEVERAFLYTVGALARAAEFHDEDTGNHILRVGEYSKALARALGYNASFVRTIAYSARMHDVGKLYVHPDILKKPGRLSREEWREIKMHTIHGPRILGDDPRLAMAREVAASHHERWDGSGYPHGLRGKEIPLSARIVAVADVYDALRCRRPYKPSFDHETTLGIMLKGDDRSNPSHFDPRVLEAFGDIHGTMNDIFVSLK